MAALGGCERCHIGVGPAAKGGGACPDAVRVHLAPGDGIEVHKGVQSVERRYCVAALYCPLAKVDAAQASAALDAEFRFID